MEKIVLFGDSLMAGVYEDQPTEILHAHLQEALANMGYPNFTLIDMGKRGESSQDGLQRIEEVIKEDPKFVVILFGNNDMLSQSVSVEAYGENLSKMITSIGKEKIFLVSPTYINTAIKKNVEETTVKEYVGEAKRVAEESNVPIIDLYHYYTVYPAPEEFVQKDGIHPSKEGYEFLANLIARDIKERMLAVN